MGSVRDLHITREEDRERERERERERYFGILYEDSEFAMAGLATCIVA